ncbi:MAG: PqqD family peptide modification chaperone [Candidatus Accumulibacter sp.]|uniref:PqqD family peptide modification chaperone n=1 Tax=Candidatus Accumulibacter affinis TaxID=2954384 RepID=A0A935TA25_9PROT|nr:PqqD family peptide modification chaperone [Candidatus Accumulibacter affinis]
MTGGRPFLCPLGESAVAYYPAADRLLFLNPTGKMVWELANDGHEPAAIASVFARSFGISEERAWQDVGQLLRALGDAGSQSDRAKGDDVNLVAATGSEASPAAAAAGPGYCGIFRFGDSRIKAVSSVAAFDGGFFARFQHRVIEADGSEEVLQVSQNGCGYLLTFRDSVLAEATTTSVMTSFVCDLLLTLEHPNRRLLAFCHAGALVWNEHSLLMPGLSGAGKSTLTAFLAAHGFLYLGDDWIAVGEDDAALLPLPTCLSIKSGSWPLLDPLYPALRSSPTLNRFSRSLRYVDPQDNCTILQAAPAPSAIVFPTYAAGEPTQLKPVSPLQTMIGLLGAHARLSAPATEAKLRKLIDFVEQTPAYELSYSDLPEAMQVIKELLASQSQ